MSSFVVSSCVPEDGKRGLGLRVEDGKKEEIKLQKVRIGKDCRFLFLASGSRRRRPRSEVACYNSLVFCST